MLFHATHAHDENKKAKMVTAIQAAGEIGINIHGIYVNPTGHIFYLIFQIISISTTKLLSGTNYWSRAHLAKIWEYTHKQFI